MPTQTGAILVVGHLQPAATRPRRANIYLENASPVPALAAARRAFHLAQQRVHFIPPETAARAHRMVAGHRREYMIEPPFDRREGAIVLAKCYGEIANEARRVA